VETPNPPIAISDKEFGILYLTKAGEVIGVLRYRFDVPWT